MKDKMDYRTKIVFLAMFFLPMDFFLGYLMAQGIILPNTFLYLVFLAVAIILILFIVATIIDQRERRDHDES